MGKKGLKRFTYPTSQGLGVRQGVGRQRSRTSFRGLKDKRKAKRFAVGEGKVSAVIVGKEDIRCKVYNTKVTNKKLFRYLMRK